MDNKAATTAPKLLEKAWKMQINSANNGAWSTERLIIHAATAEEAKTKLFDKSSKPSLMFQEQGVSKFIVTTTREEEEDIYECNNSRISLREIKEQQRSQEFSKILKGSHNHYFIKKEEYYYRADSKEYTESELEAGIYNKYQAVIHAKSCNDLELIPVDIEEHNLRIAKRIISLRSLKIN